MNKEEMIKMLDEGYTPEYISLQKWLQIRRKWMAVDTSKKEELRGNLTLSTFSVGFLMLQWHIGDIYSENCALCRVSKRSGSPHKVECEDCSLHKLGASLKWNGWTRGCSTGSPWHRLSSGSFPNILTNITNMVNNLQLLVCMYGIKREE